MNDSIETLIKEIALKHGIAVGQDDPILILHTMNQHLIEDHKQAQQALLTQFKEELENMTHRWEIESNAKVERILNTTIAASKEVASALIQEGTSKSLHLIKAELHGSLQHINSSLQETKRFSSLSLISGGLILMAAISTLIATFL